jgi:16S rRNA (guanine527-N7)-methyltransferase
VIGADARAGRDADHSPGRPKGSSEGAFFVSEPDASAARRALELHLERDAPGLAALIPPGFADAAELYIGLLLEANARLNLTRVVEPGAVARLHLLDALAALPYLDRMTPRSAIDLGSGGGVPGMLLAIARPSISWTLVDSVGKKADALRGFAAALRCPNVVVRSDRAEALGRDPAVRGHTDLVTARACAALPVLVEYALPLLRVGGSLIAWKGPIGEDELRAGGAAAAELGGGPPHVERTGIEALGDHRFVIVEKERPTPDRYPRRPGEPARRPLGS